jgi:hypothetical protein
VDRIVFQSRVVLGCGVQTPALDNMTPDLIERIKVHVESMHWIARMAYLNDRGWFYKWDHSKPCPDDRQWQSPHDGSLYPGGQESAVTLCVTEMIREAEGNPTPRLGIAIDIERGERWEDGKIVSDN